MEHRRELIKDRAYRAWLQWLEASPGLDDRNLQICALLQGLPENGQIRSQLPRSRKLLRAGVVGGPVMLDTKSGAGVRSHPRLCRKLYSALGPSQY